MNIRIQSLSLTNFKCFREKELTFDGDVTTIRGRNGEGKTTIADAIIFCLFGKDTEGRSDLEVFKTIDKETKRPIPHLDHSVEMVLRIESILADEEYVKDVTLRRTIKEEWVKKRGASEVVFKNNKQEFSINGDDTTPTDYKKYIDSLINEKTFRAITNPTEFTSWHWKDQRTFLTSMVGSVESESVATTDELKALVKELDNHNEDIEAHMKHLGYKKKGVKEKLDRIPVRLEEQNKALPEKLDWDGLQEKLNTAEATLKDVESKISQMQQGNGADVKRKELRQQINATTMAIDKLRLEANKKANEALLAHNQKVNQYGIQFSNALNNQKLMEQTIQADERLIERCGEIDFEAELQKLRDQWPSKKFEIDESAGICPTCGQPLPQEQWKEKVDEMRKNFNLQREAKIKDLQERAAIIKKDQAESIEEQKRLEQKLTEDKAKLEEIKQSINEIFSDKAKAEKEPVITSDVILVDDSTYVGLTVQLGQLKTELESVSDTDDNKAELEELLKAQADYKSKITFIQLHLATKAQYEKITSLIDGIKAEEKDLVKQLSELERQEDVAREYQTRQNQILESRINEHFKIVQWKLFKTVNNGGDSFEEPFCECFVDGIPFHSGLNQAARLNAGLDVINALCQFYQVSAPITIDNAESTINILPTVGQQLRLQVFDSELNLV